MQSYPIENYLKALCGEMMVPVMRAVHGMTGGKVCETGCHAFNDGKCPAYKRLTKVIIEKKRQIETVRQEAKRRGISISEVRRQNVINHIKGE